MENLSLASCVITAIVVYTIYTIATILLRLGSLYKKASKFEGPQSLPFLGNAHLFIGDGEALLNRFTQLGKTYPSPYRLWFGNRLIFVVNTPEQLQVVLLSPKTLDKTEFYDFGKPWVGTGLITAPASKWRVHRKLIQPTFHSKILESFVEIFATQSSITAKRMEKNSDGPEFEVRNYISTCSLNSICETTMGVRLEEQMDSKNRYADAVKKVLQGIGNRIYSPWLYPDFIFYRTQLGKEQRENIKTLHDFTANVIERKKKEFRERSSRSGITSDESSSYECNSISGRKVLLNHLMELSSESGTLSNEELREEVDTMIAAGYETSTVVTLFVLLMLASHPEVQEKAYQELYEIYGEDDNEERNVVPEDLTRMMYLERVIKETMRLFPVVPIIARKVTDDLDIGGHILSKGGLVALGLMDLHRNPDYWPDPFKFDPDRFLPEEVEKRHPYAYLPFSAGPRSCIGQKYAIMSMKTLISTILRRYVLKKDYITPVKDIRLRMDFTLKPVDPISLRIQKRVRKLASAESSDV